MAVDKYRYRSLDDTLSKVMLQVRDSQRYARELAPDAPKDPLRLWWWLKSRIQYKNDKKGVEQLQTLQTLMDAGRNVHGIAGAGDCDCFTIAMLAMLKAKGYREANIVLASRKRSVPTHIYPGMEVDGSFLSLDLTNSAPGVERNYPYRQYINVPL